MLKLIATHTKVPFALASQWTHINTQLKNKKQFQVIWRS